MKKILLLLLILLNLLQVFPVQNLKKFENEELDQFERDILYLEQKYKGDQDFKIRLINQKKAEKVINERNQEQQKESKLFLNSQDQYEKCKSANYQEQQENLSNENDSYYQDEIDQIDGEQLGLSFKQLKNQRQGSSPLDLKKLKSAYKDYCLKDMETMRLPKKSEDMNLKEKLDAFNKGPCSPVILMPGILGTSLEIQIDCKKLQKSSPEVFKSCGWNTCQSYIPLVRNPPKKEYRLWIGGLTSPMSIFSWGSQNNENSKCFGNLMKFTYNLNAESPEDQYISEEGTIVTIQGNSPGTRDQSQCGDTAIGKLFYSESIDWLDCAFNGYDNMQQLLQAMGYAPSITYQSLPYDFRKAVGDTQTAKNLMKSLENLHKFTGKKTHVITHSYGSLHTLFALNQFSQEFKDQHINSWIPTGGPFSGAPKIINSFLNVDQDFIQEFGSILGKTLIVGIQFYSQRILNSGSMSMYDLFPKDIQYRHKDTDWMKEILERVKYEQIMTSQDGDTEIWNKQVPFDILPEPTEICRPNQGESQYCKTYIYNQLDEHIAEIEEDKYYLTTEDMMKMLKKYSDDQNIIDKFEKAYFIDAFLDLKNPGVKVTNVYGAFAKVTTQFEFQENVREYTEREEYYFPNITSYTFGDGTVTSSSALMGPLKWIHENRKGDNKNHKPVKLVEMCSKYNIQDEANDEFQQDGQKIYTKSGYIGLDCSCFYTGKIENCEHSCMISEPFYLQFIANTIAGREISQYVNGEKEMPYFDHYYLSDFIGRCDNLVDENEEMRIQEEKEKEEEDRNREQQQWSSIFSIFG